MGEAMREADRRGLMRRGKVRDIYDLGNDELMIVASDRISAFDVVMNEPVPGKGKLLTAMSRFWLECLPTCSPHHLKYVVDAEHAPPSYEQRRDELSGRAMVVRQAIVLPIECVVRGYLAGSGWKDYQATRVVSGVTLPSGLKLADRLSEPVFTPSTKAVSGHDEPISFDEAVERLAEFLRAAPFKTGERDQLRVRAMYLSGADPRAVDHFWARQLLKEARARSLAIYTQAAEHARRRGIILADTKFEFGLCRGELTLVDEVLTPDSSRFWPSDQWRPGENPPSFDKQFLRDYLNSLPWPKTPPPPPIPADILAKTQARYAQAFELLAG